MNTGAVHGQELFEISRVGLGWVMSVFFYAHGSGRVGSGHPYPTRPDLTRVV